MRWLRELATRRFRRIGGHWMFWTKADYADHDRIMTMIDGGRW